MKESIAVYSLFRDSEPYLARTLSQFEDLESLDYNFEYYFYENDSTDNTVQILEDWLKNRSGKFLHEKLKEKKFGSVPDMERMELLTMCRNKCKKLLSDSSSKYTILVDSDIFFNKENLERHIEFLQINTSCVLSTPNVRQNIFDYARCKTDDSYYDTHAIIDLSGDKPIKFSDCPFRGDADIFKWNMGIPVECLSAFGGFSLTYTNILKEVEWSTDGLCEHVNFCSELRKHGSVCVDSRNKVSVVHEESYVKEIHDLFVSRREFHMKSIKTQE
jgi:hypothetical protein